jgi:hypothetical protein
MPQPQLLLLSRPKAFSLPIMISTGRPSVLCAKAGRIAAPPCLRRLSVRFQATYVILDPPPFLPFALSPRHRGDVFALGGVLVLGVLDNGLTQMRVDSYLREVMVGLIILTSVGVSALSQKRR